MTSHCYCAYVFKTRSFSFLPIVLYCIVLYCICVTWSSHGYAILYRNIVKKYNQKHGSQEMKYLFLIMFHGIIFGKLRYKAANEITKTTFTTPLHK